MSISTSVLDQLLAILPNLHPQIYFKSSLTALSHAMEDQVLAGSIPCLVIANFQQERFYRQEAQRYRRIARLTSQVYVLSAPETGFTSGSGDYERVAFDPNDCLRHEWHLVVISSRYSACLICREKLEPDIHVERLPVAMDQNRRFEGIWTFDGHVSRQAANILLDRILSYRPELVDKIIGAKAEFLAETIEFHPEADADPFAQRLITYLQAGQYKLLKAYRAILSQGRREHLVNLITSAIRQSLDPDQIFSVAVHELGQTMQVDRCFIYPCRAHDEHTMIQHEFLQGDHLASCVGSVWPLSNNPLFQSIARYQETIAIENVETFLTIDLTVLQRLIDIYSIRGWLIVPIIHQKKLVGIIELMTEQPMVWGSDDLKMVDAIASQLGVAVIQADAYANLEALNQQLAALERTRSNLIAITGHELRTPLSTIQVCLESLASEPDMPQELQQVMLSTALNDAERLRKLVQDFLTLSQLESGRVEWHLEALSMEECIELALSSIRTRQHSEQIPSIQVQVAPDLPFVRGDGEWLVEVLSKLLDNACKFTQPDGEVQIVAKLYHENADFVEVTVADTGRGIEANQLKAVFDRFHQEEGALRRTAGGTGLGLAICHQVISNLEGKIWATSDGHGQGSQFHFIMPVVGTQRKKSSKPDHNSSIAVDQSTNITNPNSTAPNRTLLNTKTVSEQGERKRKGKRGKIN